MKFIEFNIFSGGDAAQKADQTGHGSTGRCHRSTGMVFYHVLSVYEDVMKMLISSKSMRHIAT